MIDTAWDYLADGNGIRSGDNVPFEAICFYLKSHDQIKSTRIELDWLEGDVSTLSSLELQRLYEDQRRFQELKMKKARIRIKKLGVERASNKELYLICENGPSHATACYLDGVMAATGCTYGKGNAEKKNWGKNAITLIDVKTKRAVRVTMNPKFQKRGLASEFVKLRSQGIEPKDIKPEVVNPLIENILKANDKDLFISGEVFDTDLKGPKGTFNWHECEICNEIVFENTTRIVNGKKVCIPCFESR